MEPPKDQNTLNIQNIKAIKILGKGATGTVFLAYDQNFDPHCISPFALKVIQKHHHDHDHDISLERRARWEISVLSSTNNHPYLPTFLGFFETQDLLGWATPFCPGGDLNALRYYQNDHVFSTFAIKFYLAQIVCALAHLHSMGIAYRDLKPENVLVQCSGHVTLTDFDLSRKLTFGKRNAVGSSFNDMKFKMIRGVRKNNLTGSGFDTGVEKVKSSRVSPGTPIAGGRMWKSFVGTEEYVSPEVIKAEGHEFGVDWWALGILAYEMLYGKTPFRGKNRNETFRNVISKRPEFLGKRTPLIDLIQQLLQKDPTERLGYFRGVDEIKNHVFFSGLRWDLLTEVERPPFVPPSVEIDLSKVVTFHVQDYFLKPPLLPPSPTSLTDDDDSLTEF